MRSADRSTEQPAGSRSRRTITITIDEASRVWMRFPEPQVPLVQSAEAEIGEVQRLIAWL